MAKPFRDNWYLLAKIDAQSFRFCRHSGLDPESSCFEDFSTTAPVPRRGISRGDGLEFMQVGTSLFERDKSVISRHIRNVFSSGELSRDSVVAFFATTAADDKTYNVEHFNLDAILSVGYRVNSQRGTQFRIWATNVLRKHLVDGYTINETRLKAQQKKIGELQNAVRLLGNIAQLENVSGESRGIIQGDSHEFGPSLKFIRRINDFSAHSVPSARDQFLAVQFRDSRFDFRVTKVSPTYLTHNS